MGCGTSFNENDVQKPSQTSFKSQQDFKSTGVISAQKQTVSEKVVNQSQQQPLHQLHSKKQPFQKKQNIPSISEFQEQSQLKKQPDQPITKLFLFGQTSIERKIVAFDTSPLGFHIINSRNNNPTPTKYAPTEVILEQSQELFSSHLFCSTSHPPYNFMFATHTFHDTIFLCGGVNFDFDIVSNEAFIYKTNKKTEQSSGKSSALHRKKQRGLGNNLMGINFQKLALMKTKRYSHMGVYLKAGKLSYVFVLGGRTEGDTIIKKCQKYCFEENKWIDIADLNMPRSTGFSIVFNKKIYVFGGYVSEGKRTKKIQRYNSIQDSWEVLSFKLHKGIETGIIFPCPTNGQILIVGGNVEYGAIKTVTRINFKEQEYMWDSDMKYERLLQKGIYLKQQNLIYIFGGDFQDTIEKYSFKDKSWKTVDKLAYADSISPDDINSFTVTQETINIDTQLMEGSPKKKQPNQQMEYKYIFGSDDYPCIFQLNITKWVLKKKYVPMSLRLRSFMTVIKIREGKYFMGGGIDSYFEGPSKAAYLYYSGTNKAIEIGKMKQKKYQFAGTVHDNSVYIFGGRLKKEGEIINYCEKYDLKQEKWIQLQKMPRERACHKVVTVEGRNKIILFGGMDSYQSLNEIDIYNAQTNTFSTLKAICPIPLDPKAIYASNFRVQKVVLKKKTDFQFLQEENAVIKEEQQQKQQEEAVEEQKIDLTVFSYNYLLKNYTSHRLNVSLNGSEQVVDEKKEQKLMPFSLNFKQKGYYYFISEKGVMKMREGHQLQGQIVINQIQMLQMPLEKFSIA